MTELLRLHDGSSATNELIHRNRTLATPSKFDALTLSLEQYDDLDKMSLDETIGLLSVHELRLKEHELGEEEQTLLATALSKLKISTEEESSSRRRGRHHN
ncbi:unnamed protein product [Spirodela intermedia]|uniref:Uncharacterized protein n=2 Tax=Spirodela intermedia TaxID=51605 RepID=A0A7I8KH91_SPIIN|nr:unnamed protein product [Spirodela intermedia]CAA6660192.1 unnamed protein product [Spirodela intermedia]CAA7396514.1 unnamed protein product [Spirodela intermedia]